MSVFTQDASSPLNAQAVGTSSGTVIKRTRDGSVYLGAWVYVDAGGTVHNAQADSDTTWNVLGVVEKLIGSTECLIRVSGLTDVIFAGLDVTKTYRLSNTTAGAMQSTPVLTSGHIDFVLGQPGSATEFVVDKGPRTVRA